LRRRETSPASCFSERRTRHLRAWPSGCAARRVLSVFPCVEYTLVIRRYRWRQPRCRQAGSDLDGPAPADRARGRAGQLDPRRRAALCAQPWGRDQADAAGARDGQPGAGARSGGHRRPRLEPHEAALQRLVAATPDITLAELQAALQRRFGLAAVLSTIHSARRRIGPRHKTAVRRRPTAPRAGAPDDAPPRPR
jgi:hypothetical protein